MTPSRGKPQDDFETVIDQPLERSQCSNHANTDGETVPETSESDIAVDSRHGFSSALTSYRITSAHRNLSCLQLGKLYVRCLSAFNLLTITSAG